MPPSIAQIKLAYHNKKHNQCIYGNNISHTLVTFGWGSVYEQQVLS
jgi:hypothetical protein